MADRDDENHALRLKIMGYIVAQAIFAMTELGVPDVLADGPLPVCELAGATGADPDALHRFLRVLVAEGLLDEKPPGTFALTPMGGLLRGDVPGSLRHFALLMSGESYTAWGQATHSVRTGLPAFDVVFGASHFTWLAGHAAASALFNRSQAGLAELRLLPLLDRDWTGVRTVVDVGGGTGMLLATLLDRQPGLRGVLFDQPHVIAEARPALETAGLADRVRCVGGDFFTGLPAGGDVYVLAQILHDWDDRAAGEILRQCHRAMRPGGRLLALEQVIREDATPHPAKLLDLHMLVMLGGRERTETDWRRLLTGSGFDLTGITHSARSDLIEARVGEPAG